jgi:hypothetical protein
MLLRMLFALCLLHSSARAFDITACGQAVGAGEVGDLRTDFACPSGVGVHLSTGGTVNLNGHTITGGGTLKGTGVTCSGRRHEFCVVNGPGLITNFHTAVAGGGGSIRLQGLVLSGNAYGMTYKAPRVIELIDVDASDNLLYGISARGGRIVGHDVSANRNGTGGIIGPIDELIALTATGNGVAGGVHAARGARRRPPHLIDSTITGNNGLGRGFDVLTTTRLKLLNTTCGQAARVRIRGHGDERTTTVRRKLSCVPE